MTRILGILFAAVLSGCVTYAPTVPEGYDGELAIINDTCAGSGRNWAHFFYLEALNGEKTDNARELSNRLSQGQGQNLPAYGFLREVPAESLNLTIAASRLNAAPIVGLFDRSMSAQGEIEVELSPGGIYIVRGIVDKEYSAVWLEDFDGNRVSEIIEEHDGPESVVGHFRTTIPELSAVREPPSRQQRFAQLSECEHTRIVEAKIGPPDNFSERSGSGWPGRPRLTIYHYDGLGEIHLIRQGNNQFVFNIMFSALQEADLTPTALQERLDTHNAEVLRSEARGVYSRQVRDPLLLDIFAQRLWEGRNAEDALLVDAMAWFCRVLGQSGDGRYWALLDGIAQESSNTKLRRYAETSRDQLSPDSSHPFTP